MKRLALLGLSIIFCANLHAEESYSRTDVDSRTATFSVSQYDVSNAIEGQLNAIIRGDFSKAYFSFGSKQFRDKISFEEFKKFVLTYKDYWKDYSFDWSTVKVADGVAEIKGFLTPPSGKKLEINYTLVKEEGRWKVFKIRLSLVTSPLFPSGGASQ